MEKKCRVQTGVTTTDVDACGLHIGMQRRLLPMEVEAHAWRYLDIASLGALFLCSHNLSHCIIRFMQRFMWELYDIVGDRKLSLDVAKQLQFGLGLATQHCRVLRSFLIPRQIVSKNPAIVTPLLRNNTPTLRQLSTACFGLRDWALLRTCHNLECLYVSKDTKPEDCSDFAADSQAADLPRLRSLSLPGFPHGPFATQLLSKGKMVCHMHRRYVLCAFRIYPHQLGLSRCPGFDDDLSASTKLSTSPRAGPASVVLLVGLDHEHPVAIHVGFAHLTAAIIVYLCRWQSRGRSTMSDAERVDLELSAIGTVGVASTRPRLFLCVASISYAQVTSTGSVQCGIGSVAAAVDARM